MTVFERLRGGEFVASPPLDDFEQHAYPSVPDVHAGLREIRPPYSGRNIGDGLEYDLTSGKANLMP